MNVMYLCFKVFKQCIFIRVTTYGIYNTVYSIFLVYTRNTYKIIQCIVYTSIYEYIWPKKGARIAPRVEAHAVGNEVALCGVCWDPIILSDVYYLRFKFSSWLCLCLLRVVFKKEWDGRKFFMSSGEVSIRQNANFNHLERWVQTRGAESNLVKK